MSETIAALATAPLIGAVAIVRISGSDAFIATKNIFKSSGKKTFDQSDFRYMQYGSIIIDGKLCDKAMAVKMQAPYSYTGEDMCELHLHGSMSIVNLVLNALYKRGVRPAEPGEFTKRAFLHGKMNLSQAEAVMDMITAETKDAARNAAGQLTGKVGQQFTKMYDKLANLLAHFSASIDYTDQDIPPVKLEEIKNILTDVDKDCCNLLSSFAWGCMLKDGIRTAIIGKPNVGKSSLLNALLGYERAIVTPYKGTTRDTLEECITLGGVKLRLTDTAGVHKSHDPVEKIGIERTWELARDCEVIFVVLDGTIPLDEDDRAVLDCLRDDRGVVIVNKCDQELAIDVHALEAAFLYVSTVSAKTGEGVGHLDALLRRLFDNSLVYDGSVLSNARQADALTRTHSAVCNAHSAIISGVTLDAVLGELELALSALGELTGRHVSEDVLTRVFKNFCVGK